MTTEKQHESLADASPYRSYNGCSVRNIPGNANKRLRIQDDGGSFPWKIKYFWSGITVFGGAAMIAGAIVWNFLKNDWERVERRLEQHDARLEKVVDVLSALAQKVSGLTAAQDATKEATEHRMTSVEDGLSDLGKKVDGIAQRPFRAEAEPHQEPTYKPQKPKRPVRQPVKDAPRDEDRSSAASAFDALRR